MAEIRKATVWPSERIDKSQQVSKTWAEGFGKSKSLQDRKKCRSGHEAEDCMCACVTGSTTSVLLRTDGWMDGRLASCSSLSSLRKEKEVKHRTCSCVVDCVDDCVETAVHTVSIHKCCQRTTIYCEGESYRVRIYFADEGPRWYKATIDAIPSFP